MQYTSLTLEIKKLNSLVPVHRTLFCVKIYGSYKRLKNSPVFMTHPIFTRYMHLVTSCSGGGGACRHRAGCANTCSGDWPTTEWARWPCLTNSGRHETLFPSNFRRRCRQSDRSTTSRVYSKGCREWRLSTGRDSVAPAWRKILYWSSSQRTDTARAVPRCGASRQRADISGARERKI